MRLNLGCGRKILEGYINSDVVALEGVDVVLNADDIWPWDDGSIDEILAEHVFEHVNNPIHFMTEAHRVLADDGLLHIIVPSWQSIDAFTDPTHKRFCTVNTFDYWLPGTPHFQNNEAYGNVSFKGIKRVHDGRTIDVMMRKVIQ